LQLHGQHNAQNALAAATLCAEIGVAKNDILAALKSFGGIRRRFEIIGERNDVLLIADYAHHPTAVRATLRTARQIYGQRRLWCVFQPHQVSRTNALMEEFATSFADADEVVITPVFAARERVTDEPRRVSQELVRRIAATGRSARFIESLDQIMTTVDDAARPGDVLIAMGAGDIDRINHEFTRTVC
jgi:UDP-N-acetylmuramate--alanine ligase